MNTWPKAKLSDIYKFQYGKGNKNPSNGGKYPVYGAGSIIGYFDQYNAENSPVIGHMGANCGTVIFGRGKHFVTYNGIMALTKTGHDPMFGYYLLLSKDFKKSIRGSAQPFISYDLLDNVDIFLPDFPTQERIGSVLSAYDNLIENNEKRIKALEEMAQLLYTEWFVKFKFPGYEKARMVDSGTEYGMLPERWVVGKIDDHFNTVLGGTPSRNKTEFWLDGTVPWINSGAVNNFRITEASELITELALEKSATKMMPKRSTLLAITGATLGQVSLTEIECCANQSVVGIWDKENLYNEYIYFKIKDTIKDIIARASGSAQPHINKEDVKAFKIIIPDKEIMSIFHEIVKSIFDDIALFILQNNNLSKTRDLLTPQLVTGRRILKNNS